MNNIDLQYQNLLKDILDNGIKKADRTGTGTISVFGRQIRHKMSEGFPLLTTKKIAWKQIVTELLWFLRGDTNIKYLVDNGCHIWTGDAYKNYIKFTSANDSKWDKWMRNNGDNTLSMYTKEEFINKVETDNEFVGRWGELGPIYGKQWRRFGEEGNKYSDHNDFREGIDQIKNLINDLKNNPDSRRLIVTAWNPSDIHLAVLPPCHYSFQCYTRELTLDERCKLANFAPFDDRVPSDDKGFEWDGHTIEIAEDWLKFHHPNLPKRAISLCWTQRSCDTLLGIPYNIASYGLLLEIIAKEVNMISEDLIGNLGDTHLYLNHIEQAKEQITRTPYESPNLIIKELLDAPLKPWDIGDYTHYNFELKNYKSHPAIKAALSN